MAESIQKLSPKTVKAVLQEVTIPLKWAHLNGMTENNCYSGIILPKSTPKKKVILSLEGLKSPKKLPSTVSVINGVQIHSLISVTRESV